MQRHAEEYLPLVRKVARRIARRLPDTVTADELVGAGTIGLLEAMDRYDPSHGRSFETYAEFRVKGAILDELRREDPLNRATRSAQTRIAAKRRKLTAELGRPPEREELAAALDVSIEKLDGDLARREACHLVQIDHQQLAQPRGDCSHHPEQAAAIRQRVRIVRQLIGELSERQQMVLNLYYVEELNQQSIGELMGVSESRVCQILSQARQQLRRQIEMRGL